MGYYYTTEPEAAPGVISYASPKTHTPASPVKERGHRYYMPETGRWASRDPVMETGHVSVGLILNSHTRYDASPIGQAGLKCYSGNCGKAAKVAPDQVALPAKMQEQDPGVFHRLYFPRVLPQAPHYQSVLYVFCLNNTLNNNDPLGLKTAAECVSDFESCYDGCTVRYSGNRRRQALCYAGCSAELAACMAGATLEWCQEHPVLCCGTVIIIIIPKPIPIPVPAPA